MNRVTPDREADADAGGAGTVPPVGGGASPAGATGGPSPAVASLASPASPDGGSADRASPGDRRRRARRTTARRVLRIELSRGTAPVAALAIAVAGAGMLFNETERWAGRWGPFADYLSVISFVLLPIAVAAAAWQAGRDRRRRTGELLTSTPRPAFQPLLVTWAAVTLGALAGMAVAWLSGAVLVARVASYGGGAWWWTLAVVFSGVAGASALGVAAGRLPFRMVAPVGGLTALVVLGIVSALDGNAWALLVPSRASAGTGTEYLDPSVQVLQVTWLAGLAATVLVLAGTRRRWPVAVPAAIAIGAGGLIVTGDVEDRWVADPAAREPVCTDDGGPEVCLATVNSFLLDDAVQPVREQLARWEDIDGGFVRAADELSSDDGVASGDGGTAVLDFGRLVSWNGGLSEETEYGESIDTVFAYAAQDAVMRSCDPFGADMRSDPANASLVWAAEVAYYWTLGDPEPVGVVVDDGESASLQVLLAKPAAEQEDWMSRYFAASQTCDAAAFSELLEELQ